MDRSVWRQVVRQIACSIVLLSLMAGCTLGPPKPEETQKSAPELTDTPGSQKPIPVYPTGTLPPTAEITPTTGPTAGPVQQASQSLYISSFKMVDNARGWALVTGKDLARSYILRTEDGGITWKDVTPPQMISLLNHTFYFHGSLAVLDANTAWVIADKSFPVDDHSLYGTVWRTDDGGASWAPGNPIHIYTPGPQMIVNGYTSQLSMINAQVGWLKVIIEGVMAHTFNAWFRTSDGGITWKGSRLAGDCVEYVICNYLFTDENTGYRTLPAMNLWSSAGDLQTSQAWQIEKTVDAGSTWNKVTITPPENFATELFAGKHYQPAQVDAFQIQLRQRFRQFDPGAVGLRTDFSVYSPDDHNHPLFERGVYYLFDTTSQTGKFFPFSGDLFFLTEHTGWRFSEQDSRYRLEKTTDGGKSWEPYGEEIPETGSLQFTDEQNGWMLIQRPDFSTSLLRTVDGGQSWSELNENLWEALLSNPPFASTIEPASSIPREPWIARMKAGSALVLNTIEMFDANNGWGTSLNGYVFHTGDGGHTWQDGTPQVGTVSSQPDFFATDALHAWTIILPLPGCIKMTFPGQCPDYYLSGGPVWYTQDGGQSWLPGGTFPDPTRSFETLPITIRFADEALGWANWISYDPDASLVIYHLFQTTDGGLTWTLLTTESSQREIFFLDEQIGFSFQINLDLVRTMRDFMEGAAIGTVHKTIDGGKTWIPVILPNFLFNPEDFGLSKEDTVTAIYASCFDPEFESFGAQGMKIEFPCNISDLANFTETYYSPDGGQSWTNWISNEYALSISRPPRWEQWMLSAEEFFMNGSLGWRLYKSSPDSPAWIQHTVDGGRSWVTLKTVAWQEAKFDFVNESEGWAVVTLGDEVALLHTSDGGESWEGIKPVVGELLR